MTGNMYFMNHIQNTISGSNAQWPNLIENMWHFLEINALSIMSLLFCNEK